MGQVLMAQHLREHEVVRPSSRPRLWAADGQPPAVHAAQQCVSGAQCLGQAGWLVSSFQMLSAWWSEQTHSSSGKECSGALSWRTLRFTLGAMPTQKGAFSLESHWNSIVLKLVGLHRAVGKPSVPSVGGLLI